MSDSLLEIRNLTKRYGENTVLRDLSFTVRRGEVIVVLGPSGCGKSTLLRCINALEPIQGGEILLGGEVIDRSPAGLPAPRHRLCHPERGTVPPYDGDGKYSAGAM